MLGLEKALNLVLYISISVVSITSCLDFGEPYLYQEDGPSQGGDKRHQVTSGQRLTNDILT